MSDENCDLRQNEAVEYKGSNVNSHWCRKKYKVQGKGPGKQNRQTISEKADTAVQCRENRQKAGSKMLCLKRLSRVVWAKEVSQCLFPKGNDS